MSKNNNHLWNYFEKANKSLNNTNTFLLDISIPLINYLLHKNEKWEPIFRTACWNNRLFASEQLDKRLFEATESFLANIYIISDYINCDCHNLSAQEFHHQIAVPFRDYCLTLIQYVDKKNLDEKLQKTAPELYSDMGTIQKELLDTTIDLATAETALLYWQDAISNTMLQEVLLLVRYCYINKFLH